MSNLSILSFDVEEYFNFINDPIPNHDTRTYQNIVTISDIIKGMVEERIGQLDRETIEYRFKGNNEASLQFDIETVVEVQSVKLATDGYTFDYEFPSGSYYFKSDTYELIRDPLYTTRSDYDQLDQIGENDPGSFWPSNSYDVRGNIKIRYVVGWSSWSDVPSDIKRNLMLCVKEYSDFTKVEPSLQAPELHNPSSYDYDVLEKVVDKRFQARIVGNDVMALSDV